MWQIFSLLLLFLYKTDKIYAIIRKGRNIMNSKKEELTKIHVRIVNMRSASFEKIVKKLKKRKSKIFDLSFCNEEEKVSLPEDSIWTIKDLINTYNNLDAELTKNEMNQQPDIYLFITDYKVKEGNFGGCCDDTETYFYLSFYEVENYLKGGNIELVNFVQIAIYRDVLRHLCGKRIAHDKVKWCIFDTNSEERLPLITESCTNPAICCECRKEIEDALDKNKKPIAYLTEIDKALRKLKKGFYYRLKDLINNHPWWVLLITTVFSIVTSLIASIIYDVWIKKALETIFGLKL